MFQSRNRKILHVDMDAFFVSVEEVIDPLLIGKPVIVGGDPNGRGVVAAASYAARKFGIRSAIPVARARRLCPHAIFLRGNHKLYAEFSERIFKIFETFSPCVQPMSLDEAYLDFTGCERLCGPVLIAAERIRERVRSEVGVNCSIGIASNKLVAKIASDFAKPSGMFWVAEHMEQTFLAPLTMDRIPGVGPKTGQRLRRMGIKTVSDFLVLPLELLEEVYGSHGRELYNRARGICVSPVVRRDDTRSISRETTFETDSSDTAFLRSTLSYLVEKASARLREENLYAKCVTLKLRYSDFKTVTRSHTLSKTVCEDHVFYKTASELLTKLLTRRSRVRLIGVALTSLTDHPIAQTDLFAKSQPEQWDKLYRGIDHIRKKYGFKSILHGSSLGGT